jgi:methylmalonyl-CoA/ethylmalonyl-CoA epimerase
MADGLFPDLKWHHAGFSVNDIDLAIAFYGEVFGMELERRMEIAAIGTKIAFLRRDNFRFELFEKAGSAPIPDHAHAPNTDLTVQGIKHACFAVDDCQDALERLHARSDVEIVGIIREVGKPMVTEDNPRLKPGMEPAKAFFFRDPCGLLVEILRVSDFPE